jgi:hypothetical protein
MPKHNTGTLEQRLLNLLNKTDTCWLWTGATTPEGYGKITFKHRHVLRTHRVAYKAWVNPEIPKGIKIKQTCGNRLCCNPEHLIADPWTDDCLNNKTERMRGEQHHNKKFTTEQVLEMKRLWFEFQFKQTEIAKIFNTKQSVVQRIISGKSWKHLNGGK